MYFYSETAPRSNSKIDVWKMNGSEAYLRHFDNFLFLDFLAKNGSRAERADAEKEILICKRKLAFWERHPNFDAAYVQRGKEMRIKQWRQGQVSKTGSGVSCAA